MSAVSGVRYLNVLKKPIQSPNGFNFTPSIAFVIYRDVDGTIKTTFEASNYAPTGKTYYVTTAGLDTNDGLSEATAFRSIQKAVSMSDVDKVMVKAGMYSRTTGTFPTSPTRSVSIIGYGGTVTFSAHDGLVWATDATYTNTYKATRSTVADVFDQKTLDAYGDGVRLTNRTSIADVEANPGSWYSDGTSIYVRTSDSRSPDGNIRVYLAVKNAYVTGGITVYLEGINFEGGNSPLQVVGAAGAVPTIIAKNCKFKYGTSTDGVNISGAKSYFQSCEASQTVMADGFNYHIVGAVNCQSVEIDCIGRHNGLFAVGSNCNGSSTHDGNKIIRVNGRYHNNNGPNVVDVNGAQSWNVGTVAYKSVGISTQNVNFYIDGEMWIDSCVSVESTTDLRVNPGTMYTRNLRSLGVNSLTSGTVVPY